MNSFFHVFKQLSLRRILLLLLNSRSITRILSSSPKKIVKPVLVSVQQQQQRHSRVITTTQKERKLFDDWYIAFQNTSNITFDDDFLMHQAILYEISKNKTSSQIISTIYLDGCQVPISSNTTKDNQIVRILDNEVINSQDKGKEIDYDEVHVVVNFNDGELLEESPLWTSLSDTLAQLAYCVRTDLYFMDESIPYQNYSKMSVSFTETNFFLTFDLSVNFESAVTMGNKDFLNVYQDVNTYVTSCICEDGYTCMNSPSDEGLILEPDKDFKICVMSLNFQTVEIQNVIFEQDGVAKLSPVINGEVNPLSQIIASTSAKDSFAYSLLVLRTRMTSAFFNDEDPSPVTVRGDAKLSMKKKKNTQDARYRYLSSQSREQEDEYDEQKDGKFVMLLLLKPPTTHDETFSYYASRMTMVLLLLMFALLFALYCTNDVTIIKVEENNALKNNNNTEEEIQCSQDDDTVDTDNKTTQTKNNLKDSITRGHLDDEHRSSIKLPSWSTGDMGMSDTWDDYEGYKAAVVDSIFKRNQNDPREQQFKESVQQQGLFNSVESIELV